MYGYSMVHAWTIVDACTSYCFLIFPCVVHTAFAYKLIYFFCALPSIDICYLEIFFVTLQVHLHSIGSEKRNFQIFKDWNGDGFVWVVDEPDFE